MLRFLRQTTDEEHVEQISKTIQFWDRWRALLLGLYLPLLVGFFVFLGWQINFVANLPANLVGANLNLLHLGSAWVFGIVIGLHLHWLAGQVFAATVGGFRTERLLVQLHNESRQIPADQD